MQHAKHQVLVEFSNEKSNFFWNTFFTYITREIGMMSHIKENENAQISDHVNIFLKFFERHILEHGLSPCIHCKLSFSMEKCLTQVLCITFLVRSCWRYM